MKQWFTGLFLIIGILITATACGNNEPFTPTVITRASVVYSVATTTTTVADTTGNETVPSETTDTSVTATTATTRPSVSVGEGGSSVTGTAIANTAASLVGTPFRAGGTSPETGFDNPSFVVYCYAQHGFTLPRRAAAMASYGEDVPPDMLEAGDILLFANELGGNPAFAAIYIGDNRFVSCNNPQSPTAVQTLDNTYWGQRFVCARRFSQSG